jgi:hypothetical protein
MLLLPASTAALADSIVILDTVDEGPTGPLLLDKSRDPRVSESLGNIDSIEIVDDGLLGWNSLALDSSGNPVVSYSLELVEGGLRVAHCNDVNCAGGDESIEDFERQGDEVYGSSLALDDSGNPVVAYVHGDALKISHCNDVNCAGDNESIESVDTGEPDTNLRPNSLVLDSSGNPVVSYRFVGWNYGGLKVLHCNDVNCAGGDESIEIVDELGGFSSAGGLTLDNSGNPVVSYHDEANGALKVLHCNDVNCAGGDESIESVDELTGRSLLGGLELDSNGNPVVSYFDDTNGVIKVLHCNDVNCADDDESIEIVDTGASFSGSSLVLDGSGYPVLVYSNNRYDGSWYYGDLKLLHCNDVNCAGGDENIQIIEEFNDPASVGQLRLDSSGNPVVSYYVGYKAGDLKILHCNDPNCAPDTINSLDDGPYILDEGCELTGDINILDNDTDPEGDPLTPVVVDPPQHASFFQVMPDGTFDYTHDGSETTSDSFTYRASDGVNESEIATVLLEITPVNDPPKIRLIGESTITVVGGAVFNDPGATADDPEDGDISDQIVIGGDSVDTNTEGTYFITYNVTDSDGLAAAEVIRTVIVEIDDPPVITLIGPATLVLGVGDTYDEPGAAAEDPEDGDISEAIVIGGDTVDTSVPGTYIVTYNVTDSGGNDATEIIRAVVVEAGDPPVITLIGPATVVLEEGDAYDDQGAMAQDPEDGDLTDRIVVDNPVDTAVPGTYTVTYTVEDSAGNQAQAQRTVIVEAAPVDQPPTISLNGAATVTITEDTYADPGATATDAEDGDLTDAITVNNPVDTSTPGTYTVTYTVQDSGGNVVQGRRTVIVNAAPPPPIDQPPTITLLGEATVTITEGDLYTDEGATASDPEDGDLTAQIVVDNPVDADTPGTYAVSYTVEDSGGNQARAQRTVIVEAAPPPPPPPPTSSAGGGGGMVSPFELLVSALMLLAIGRRHRMIAVGR